MDGVKFDESRMDESGTSVCVLLVEDEGLIAEMISLALEDKGYCVRISDNAEDALRHLASGEAVDILFTDINLPGEIDGAELANRARELRPELPIVYASGRMTSSELGLVPRSVFVSKPYDLSDICTLLHRLAPTEH